MFPLSIGRGHLRSIILQLESTGENSSEAGLPVSSTFLASEDSSCCGFKTKRLMIGDYTTLMLEIFIIHTESMNWKLLRISIVAYFGGFPQIIYILDDS